MIRRPPRSTLFSLHDALPISLDHGDALAVNGSHQDLAPGRPGARSDRKSTRLNSSHLVISYAVFCLKKKKKHHRALLGHGLLRPSAANASGAAPTTPRGADIL